MRSPTFWDDRVLPLIVDTSVVINLLATSRAPLIAAALPNRILVVDVVRDELEAGRLRGRKDADGLRELAAAHQLDIVTLGKAGWEHFESLVTGSAIATLDDGEAATIAYALEHKFAAVLDENKATRLCGDRFPKLQLMSTVDLLLHPEVRRTLGKQILSDAIFAALCDARMKVFSQDLADILRIIGPERAASCLSLPRNARKAGHFAPPPSTH